MALPRTFRAKPAVKAEPVKPFHPETLGKSTTVTRVGEAAAPTNAALIKRSSSYRRQLPTLLEAPIISLREFLLSEVIPHGLALYNGAEDARAVAAHALESDPQIGALLASADNYLQFGLRLKLLTKICGLLELTPPEAALLYTRALGTELNISDLNSLQGLVSQVTALTAKVEDHKPPAGIKVPTPKTRRRRNVPAR